MTSEPASKQFLSGRATVRTAFRIRAASEVAGAPIEVDFVVEIVGGPSRHIYVPADRMRLRPADFSFAAELDGVRLQDPMEGAPDYGGPAGVFEVARDRPWVQSLILNEFVRLEDARDLLAPGAAGELRIACRKALHLAGSEKAAIRQREPAVDVETELAVRLLRDDDRLVELVERLIGEVRHGPLDRRARPLALLLALRAPLAVERWRTLTDHPDPKVGDLVRQTLQVHKL